MCSIPQGALRDLVKALALYSNYLEILPLISLKDHQQIICCCKKKPHDFICKCTQIAYRKLLLAWELACKGTKTALTANNVRVALQKNVDDSWGVAGYFEPGFVYTVLREALYEFDCLQRLDQNVERLQDTVWNRLRPSISFRTQVNAKKKNKFCLYFGITPHSVQTEWSPPSRFLSRFDKEAHVPVVVQKLQSHSYQMINMGKKACKEYLWEDLGFYREEIIIKTQEIQQWTHFPLAETLWSTFVPPDEYTSLIVCLIDNFCKSQPIFCKQLQGRFEKEAASSGYGYGHSNREQTTGVVCVKYKGKIENRQGAVLKWLGFFEKQVDCRYDPLSAKPLGFLEQRVLSVLAGEAKNTDFLDQCCEKFVEENTQIFMSIAKKTLNKLISGFLECLRRSGLSTEVSISTFVDVGSKQTFDGLLLQKAREERMESLFWAFLVVYLVVGCSLDELRQEILQLVHVFDVHIFNAIHKASSKNSMLDSLHTKCYELEQQFSRFDDWDTSDASVSSEVVVNECKHFFSEKIPDFKSILFPHSRVTFISCWKKHLGVCSKRVRARWFGKISQTLLEDLLSSMELDEEDAFLFFSKTFLLTFFFKGFLQEHDENS